MGNNKDLKNEIDRLKNQLKSTTLLRQELENTNAHVVKLEHLINFSESASDIAHEISNPVSFAMIATTIARRSLEYFNSLITHYQELGEKGINLQKKQKEIKDFEDDIEIDLVKTEFYQAINTIEIAFERIQEVAHNLSILGRENEHNPIPINVNKCIEETLIIVNKKLNNQIEIKNNLGEISDIKSYRGKLNQVFTNLIKNSIEAIQEKPELKNEFLAIQTRLLEGKIIVKIEDSGIGMTAEIKKKIFDKFYTTKSPDRGTGLGMGVCKKIIEEHNGTIEVESERGKGTTFTITLPAGY
jgi:signal transduction histidine kinase